MAEWLRRGLQSLLHRFKSGWRLQTYFTSPGGGTVDTGDLKSPAIIWRAGSIPASGTMKTSGTPCV